MKFSPRAARKPGKQSTITESVDECSQTQSATMPSLMPVTMNVNLSAQGVDQIKDILRQ